MALTGEGSDEWLAGYPWYKVDRLLGCLDWIPGLPISQLVRRGFLKLTRQPSFPRATSAESTRFAAGTTPGSTSTA